MGEVVVYKKISCASTTLRARLAKIETTNNSDYTYYLQFGLFF